MNDTIFIRFNSTTQADEIRSWLEERTHCSRVLFGYSSDYLQVHNWYQEERLLIRLKWAELIVSDPLENVAYGNSFLI